ncbi:MAG TPA: PaaI family thioesterase [Rhabdochlamydiaceae bacterium]|nr:PaaI family thioesterase [Rhabdochlamydiaceae bacterium]
MIWKTPLSLKDLQKKCENTFISHLKIVFTEVGDDYLKAQMPMGPYLKQPIGIMHGGVSCSLAETVGTAAANHCVDATTQHCVGLDINTNHLRPVTSGILTATAKPYHLGKKTQVWSIEIHDDQNHLVSVTRLTVMALPK